MAEKLILIRHGALNPEYSGRFIGWTDVGLSADGRKQAGAIGGFLERLGHARFISSPMKRARETAASALESTGRPFDIDEELREIDFGAWEEKTFDEISTADPDQVARWGRFAKDFAFPGGESLMAFADRIARVAGRMASDPAQTVVAITHGGVIRFLICHFLGLEPRQYLLFNVDYASISIIDLFGRTGVLTRLNDGCHLEKHDV